MSNISTVIVKLSFFNHEKDVAYNPEAFAKFDEKFVKWSYDGDGWFAGVEGQPIFTLYGRNVFNVNLKWEEEMKAFCEEAKALGISHIQGEFYEYEFGMGFIRKGLFELATETAEVTEWEITDDYGGIFTFAQETQMVNEGFTITDEMEHFDTLLAEFEEMLQDWIVDDLRD